MTPNEEIELAARVSSIMEILAPILASERDDVVRDLIKANPDDLVRAQARVWAVDDLINRLGQAIANGAVAARNEEA